MANGTFAEHVKLEQELATYFDRKHSIVFSTGYAATMGMGSTLAGAGDVIVLHAVVNAGMAVGVQHDVLQVFRQSRPVLALSFDFSLLRLDGLFKLHQLLRQARTFLRSAVQILAQAVALRDGHGQL